MEIPAARIVPAVEQLAQRADGVGPGHGRIRLVQLVEADRLDAQSPGGGLGGALEVGGGAVDRPAAVSGPAAPALGRDQDAGGVAAVAPQGAGDQEFVVAPLVGLPVVAVGGVDERDARVEGGVDGGDGPLFVRAPLDGERHGAQTDGADRAVSDGPVVHGAQAPQAAGTSDAARASVTAPGSQSPVREKTKPSSFARPLLMA